MMRLQGISSVAICKTKEEARNLLKAFNPSEQTALACNPTFCVTCEAPTLATVRKEYGEQVANDWLAIELDDYQNFVGVKEDNKASYAVIKELSRMIQNRYYYLKLTEIMLFFQRLKYGDYGEMFGCVDAVRILRAFKAFVDDRNILIDRELSRQREEQHKEDMKNAISREEYERLKAERERERKCI